MGVRILKKLPSSSIAQLRDLLKSDNGALTSFVRDLIPEGWRQGGLPESAQAIDGSYLHPDEKNKYVDLVIELKRPNDEQVLIYVLAMRKPVQYRYVGVDLALGMLQLLIDWTKENGEYCDLLPIVVPIVLYQGDEPWSVPTRFSDLYGDIPEEFKKRALDFTFFAIDLQRISPDAMPEHDDLREKLLAYVDAGKSKASNG